MGLGAPKGKKQQQEPIYMGWMPASWYRPLWSKMRAFALPAFADGHSKNIVETHFVPRLSGGGLGIRAKNVKQDSCMGVIVPVRQVSALKGIWFDAESYHLQVELLASNCSLVS